MPRGRARRPQPGHERARVEPVGGVVDVTVAGRTVVGRRPRPGHRPGRGRPPVRALLPRAGGARPAGIGPRPGDRPPGGRQPRRHRHDPPARRRRHGSLPGLRVARTGAPTGAERRRLPRETVTKDARKCRIACQADNRTPGACPRDARAGDAPTVTFRARPVTKHAKSVRLAAGSQSDIVWPHERILDRARRRGGGLLRRTSVPGEFRRLTDALGATQLALTSSTYRPTPTSSRARGTTTTRSRSSTSSRAGR